MAFNILPVELNQNIAAFLTNDKDLCRFTLVCRLTYAAVHSPRSSIWRQRFGEIFDVLPGKQSHELKTQYKERRQVLRKGAHFLFGYKPQERRCLEVIRDLIVESFANTLAFSHSKNLHQLYGLIKNTNLLLDVFPSQVLKDSTNPLLQVVQLLFTHWSLDLSLGYPTHDFEVSQKMVYLHPDNCPMFLDQHMRSLNVNYVLHLSNFFKYHMTRSDEWTLRAIFEALEDDERPQAWNTKLSQGPSPLGSKWFGSYSYLHSPREIHAIRNTSPGDRIFMDTIDIKDGFQTMTLDFSAPPSTPWPEAFERHLHSLPTPLLVHALQNHLPTQKVTRAGVKYVQGPSNIIKPGKIAKARKDSHNHKHSPFPSPASTPRRKEALPAPKRGRDYLLFTGSGHDAESFHCNGIIHALPPQQGIPGFQRITLMKYFNPNSYSPSPSSPSTPDPFSGAFDDAGDGAGDGFRWDEAEVDDECWAYEGVVLPGGKVILGRWWSPLDETGEREWTGPFIFWNVSGEEKC